MIGLIGKKAGMTQVFNDRGELIPVTVIEIQPNVVVAERTDERDGYKAAVLGAFDVKEQRLTKPYRGQFREGIAPRRTLMEMRDFEPSYAVGDTFDVNLFENVGFVDVVGTSKGKGYQGVVKRHGFGGGRKTHGSKFHRENGSTGMAAFPARVIKGTKMAGRMGGVRRTAQSLRVVRVDPERNLLLVNGPVPGSRFGVVVVSRAKKKGALL